MIFRCDRCKAEQDRNMATGRVLDLFGSTVVELCNDCLLALMDWAHPQAAHASDCHCNRCIGAPLGMPSEPVKLA